MLVKEEGEGHQKDVIDGLTTTIIVPLRFIASFSGIQRLTTMPLSHLIQSVKKTKTTSIDNN